MEQNVVAIVGNGTSRANYDLMKFHRAGISVWGCNALYREYQPVTFPLPDKLVMVDDGIIEEVRHSQFPKDNIIIPTVDERWEPAEANPNRPRMNAGMAAMIQAIRIGYTRLICLGFDFLIMESAQSVSNLYDGTDNYGPNTRANVSDNGNRISFLHWLMSHNRHVTFQFVYPSNTIVHTLYDQNIRWGTYPNIDDMLQRLTQARISS